MKKKGGGLKISLKSQPLLEGVLDHIHHTGHIHFPENVGFVGADGGNAEGQPCRDFL